MIEGTSRIESGHVPKAETGIEMIVEDLEGAEKRVDLEIKIGQTLVTNVRREVVIIAGS